MTKKAFTTRLLISFLALPLTLYASQSQATDIGVDIHVGFPPPPGGIVPPPVPPPPGGPHPVPPPPVVIAPPPVPPPPPVVVPPPPRPTFYFNGSPEFIYSPFLNFSMAIGSPYDLFYDNHHYYIFHQGYWHRSSHLHGPWSIVKRRSLPPAFRRHEIEQIRKYRDREYDVYRKHRHPDQHHPPANPRGHKDKWQHKEKGHR